MKKHKREASAMESVYDIHGIDEVLLQGDNVIWLSYDAIERVVVYEGGWMGRPKIAIYDSDGTSYAYRLHNHVDLPRIVAELEGVADRRDFDVAHESGLGFDPAESIRRFFS